MAGNLSFGPSLQKLFKEVRCRVVVLAITYAKSRKHVHEKDVPTPRDPSLDGTITDKFKKLKAHLRCEIYKGHCHVMTSRQYQHLDYKNMSYTHIGQNKM